MKQTGGKYLECSIKDVEVNDLFWKPRLLTNKEVTLPYQLEKLEESGNIDNFRKAAGIKKGGFTGMVFSDSDVYKWIEAAAYTLESQPDFALKARVDELVSIISAAQEGDGYLNTYFTLVEPDKKWTNLGMMHELYCAGHLFQAATAYCRATGKKELLHAACKFAGLIDRVFRVHKRKGIPGHEVIETALVELFRFTGENRYLQLAQYFLDNRGRKDSPFKEEIVMIDSIAGYGLKRKVENFATVSMDEHYRCFFLDREGKYDGRYAQDHLPVKAQRTVEGHAVRAMYLFCGMTDVAIETGDQELITALEALWRNMTKKKMYITGGIGSSYENEGFGRDYDLPNEAAYAETCAAVGNILWNYRMLKLTGEARFADIMEQVLYNGFLSGVSLGGKEFFYTNPLADDGKHRRRNWFHVSCCPPNAARLLASLPKYIYLRGAGDVYINLYIGGKIQVTLDGNREIGLEQVTNYPWEGAIKLIVTTNSPCRFGLHLRLPGWCRQAALRVNEERIDPYAARVNGYVRIHRVWRQGDVVELTLAMPVERLAAHPAVTQNAGQTAIQRGPVVYCLEETDNSVPLEQICVQKEAVMKAYYEPGLLGGMVVVEGEGTAPAPGARHDSLYRRLEETACRAVKFKAVPYYAWGHRQPGRMRVWIRAEQ